MKFADRIRNRRTNPARDIVIALALVAALCLAAAALLATGGTRPEAAVGGPAAVSAQY